MKHSYSFAYPSAATKLLQGLVAIPSLSRHEEDAGNWLVTQLETLGYERAYVDEAGNAVGEIGDPSAEHVIVLLGHIDTVPGDIPVRTEQQADDQVLFGRGSVDAKGPLATFTMAVSRLDADWVHENDVRIVVVGAVEEEAATSKGARFIRDRFDGRNEPIPAACIIGEPSSWHRVTLGYKGRLLVDVLAGQPMAHTAGPDAGIAVQLVELWNWIAAYADEYNAVRERIFEQMQPSLREFHTHVDESMNDTAQARFGVRLPLTFDAKKLANDLASWCATSLGSISPSPLKIVPGGDERIRIDGEDGWMDLSFSGYEPAWRSPRDTALVRSFLGSIRQQGARPGFVVKTGTSDMNVVGPVWQCPILAYGPGDSSQDHTPNEHLSLTEYERAIVVLTVALKTLVQTL